MDLKRKREPESYYRKRYKNDHEQDLERVESAFVELFVDNSKFKRYASKIGPMYKKYTISHENLYIFVSYISFTFQKIFNLIFFNGETSIKIILANNKIEEFYINEEKIHRKKLISEDIDLIFELFNKLYRILEYDEYPEFLF